VTYHKAQMANIPKQSKETSDGRRHNHKISKMDQTNMKQE